MKNELFQPSYKKDCTSIKSREDRNNLYVAFKVKPHVKGTRQKGQQKFMFVQTKFFIFDIQPRQWLIYVLDLKRYSSFDGKFICIVLISFSFLLCQNLGHIWAVLTNLCCLNPGSTGVQPAIIGAQKSLSHKDNLYLYRRKSGDQLYTTVPSSLTTIIAG